MSNILQGLNETQAHDGAFLLTESRTYKLWESAGQKIVEAQLTADQINQIFKQVEQGATAAGGNRTMLGKGKDAAGAVKKAYDDLVSKVQNSGPIKGVDAMYDKAAEKLKQATGGDQGVMQYVQKYRDFAKKHPVAQSLIYSALIAAAGISGAGVGGAAALGLFKMVDKLLQGEKFSTAVGKGATTGALAYGAGQLGQALKGQPQGATPNAGAAADSSGLAQDMKDNPMLAMRAGYPGIDSGGGSYEEAFKQGLAKFAANPSNPSANDVMRAKDYAGKVASGMLKPMKESVELSESQIFVVFGKIANRKVNEGIMDTLKGAAGKAADWAKTKGTNLTTKVTADKLLQAWKKAGSPTDSLDVASIIQKAGVPSASIKQVYSTMKIPFAGEKGAGADTARKIDIDPSSVAPGAPTTPASTPTASTTTTAQAAPSSTFAQVQELVAKLDPETKTKVVSALKQELSVAEGKINELSNEKLGQYKKAASADATAADKAGNTKKADKRFSGIVKATKKQFANDEKQLKEFAADDGDGGGEEDTLRKYAKMWYNGDDTIQQQVEQILARSGWEIGELESEEGGAFVVQSGDENGDTYIGFTAADLTDEVDEAFNNYHANRTGFTRPKRDLSGEGEPQGMFMVMIDGRPWKEFTSNVAFARAKTLADKNPTKKIQVRWPTGQLNTVTEDELDENCWKGYHKEGNKELFGKTVPNCVKNEGVAEGWQEESQDLEDWSKEVNKRLYRAHESQRPALARQLSKVEQKNFGSELNKGSLTQVVHAALMALQKGQMVHYDPQSVGSMPFGNIVGDDARIIAAAGISAYDAKGYHALKRAGIVDNIQQFLRLKDIADTKGQELLKYANMDPVEGWMQFVKDIGWSKDDMNEEVQAKTDDKLLAYYAQRKAEKEKQKQQGVAEEQHSCPHCGGEMVSEELMNEKKDACYYKVKSRYKVWPSAYASGALVKCRKKGADSWGNGGKKNESSILEGIGQVDENLHKWFKEKWVRFGPDGKIRGDCARGDDSEGKPKCLPQSKAHSLGKKGRASAASRKRREDPNPERSGKAINVNTKKKANEEALDEKWSQKYKDSINCSNPKGFSQRAHCQGKNK